MSIQSTINQGLSLASLLVSQTPLAAKKRAESTAEVAERKASEKRAIEAAETERKYQALETHTLEGKMPAPRTIGEEAAGLELYGEYAGAAKARYLANPTDETYADYMHAASGYHEERVRVEDATAAAEERGRLESERLARSRAITEGIYSTDEAFDPRRTGGTR